MQINFTGIKNMGYEYRQYRTYVDEDGDVIFVDPDENVSKKDYDEDNYEHYLNVQLTDDYNGKDLTNFRNAVKTSDLCNYLHPVNPTMLNISIDKTDFTDEYAAKPEVDFFINNREGERLEVNDRNLKLFSFIGQLLKRISTLNDNDFVVNKDYIENDAATSVLLGYDLRDEYGNYYDNVMDQTHSPEIVRNGAAKMSEILTNKLVGYFK